MLALHSTPFRMYPSTSIEPELGTWVLGNFMKGINATHLPEHCFRKSSLLHSEWLSIRTTPRADLLRYARRTNEGACWRKWVGHGIHAVCIALVAEGANIPSRSLSLDHEYLGCMPPWIIVGQQHLRYHQSGFEDIVPPSS